MEWAIAALAIVVLAVAAYLGSGRLGAMPPVVDDRVPGQLPAGTLTAESLRQLRFSVVPRGYSMAQVDAIIAQLVQQLDPVPESAPVLPGGHNEFASEEWDERPTEDPDPALSTSTQAESIR